VPGIGVIQVPGFFRKAGLFCCREQMGTAAERSFSHFSAPIFLPVRSSVGFFELSGHPFCGADEVLLPHCPAIGT
jgi:hypothetical protein